MQRGGFVVYRSSGEGTLIGAVSALFILAALALLIFEVAGLQDRGEGGSYRRSGYDPCKRRGRRSTHV
jgi:hypothetical protein